MCESTTHRARLCGPREWADDSSEWGATRTQFQQTRCVCPCPLHACLCAAPLPKVSPCVVRSPLCTAVHLCSPLFTSVHLCSPLFTSVRLCSPLCAAVALTEFTVDISSSTIFRPATSSSTPSWSACPARRRAFSTSCCDANKEMIQPCLIYLHLISSVGHSKRPVSANAHRVCYTPC